MSFFFRQRGNGGAGTERRILAGRKDLLGSQTQQTTVVSIFTFRSNTSPSLDV